MKIGIYGGTFDPPHVGHGEIVSAALQSGLFDRLLILPSGNPPHKHGVTDMRKRFDMTELAFGEIAEVCDYEQSSRPSYTVETVKHFYSVTGEKNVLIVGGDSFENFFNWYKPREILEYCDLAVFKRSNIDLSKALDGFKSEGRGVWISPMDITDVSSTQLKVDLRFGKNVSNRVDKKVIDYIAENGLYSEYSAVIGKLRASLKPSRFEHTYRVVKKGMEMNGKIGLDGEKVFMACLLHDCAKYIKPECRRFTPPSEMPDEVIHAFEGRLVAWMDYGVSDTEILDAIAYHCTGCDDMKPLDKLVYVADYIEEGRGSFADPIRQTFEREGLDRAYEEAYESTERFLYSSGKKAFHCKRNEF